MTDILKQIGISAAVVVVALLLTGAFGGEKGIGGTYEITQQYFEKGIVVGSAKATSSSSFGKACWTVTTQSGTTQYVFFRDTGIATSSTSCN